MFFEIDIVQATGTTLYVGGTGEGNYSSIQDAIDDAASGDTVFVFSKPSLEAYNENIVIDKSLILTGENKDTTIIDGGKNGHVIRVYKGESEYIQCSISGFTIRNAGGTGNDCIAMSYVNAGEIHHTVLANNDLGEGIQIDHCTGLTIHDNTITDTTSSHKNSHGIYLVVSSNNIIYNNTIQFQQTGIFLDSSSSNQIYENTITESRDVGVQLELSASNNRLYQNHFTNDPQKNAQDDGTNNHWYSIDKGNYWDDYTGTDADHNGIGDTPYITNGVNDPYPLGYFQTGNQKPIATIISPSGPVTVSYGETIVFNGMGEDPDPTGYITGYRWISSIDGQFSTAQIFSYSSLSPGTQDVSFEVKDNADAWSDKTYVAITINEPLHQKPVAHIVSINPSQASFGASVYFNGYGTDDGTIIAYKWTSDIDGVLSAQSYFNRSNLSVGDHLISFQVMDNQGEWSAEDAQSLIISSTATSSNQPPIALAGGPYINLVNTSIVFDASQSYDPDLHGTIKVYTWNFGDETTAGGVQVEHTYTAPGNYTVTLQVTDNNGTKTTATTQAAIYRSGELPNQDGTTGDGSDNTQDKGVTFDIPWIIVAPVAGILIFIIIIIGFFSWMKRS